MHGSAQMNAAHHDVTGTPSQPAEPVQHDHSQMQCCMVTCVTSCGGLLTAEASVNIRMPSIYIFTAIDPRLRSLYLDSDPPVPRT